MIDWLAVRAEHQDVLASALPRAWRGGEAVCAAVGKLVVTAPDGAAARRAARWPDVLVEWTDIYEEPLFDGQAAVLGEEVSALGAEALAVSAAPGYARASVGWYRKGALVAYEHVGGAQIAWMPDHGLFRPLDSSIGSWFSGPTAGRLGRALCSDATGEHLVWRAFGRLMGEDPPEVAELAALVARAPSRRVRL